MSATKTVHKSAMGRTKVSTRLLERLWLEALWAQLAVEGRLAA